MTCDLNNEIIEYCVNREIDEVLHFTTNRGLVGVLSVGAIISRDQLHEHETLDFLDPENAKFRSDPDWVNYINLSISRINNSFFSYSRNWKKNEQAYWIIFSFRSEILAHPNVVFATTNNIYTGSVRRKSGVAGLDQCFHPVVSSKYGRQVLRTTKTLDNWTTCPESEVLYLNSIPLDYLNCIYVEDCGTFDEVSTVIETLTGRTDIEIRICPDKFKGL